MSDCSICYDAVIDFPAPEATGSHRCFCGHLFHPKCISKWHNGQDHSTCPMCRKVAVEMEDCAPKAEPEPPGGGDGRCVWLPLSEDEWQRWERNEELEALAFGISDDEDEDEEEEEEEEEDDGSGEIEWEELEDGDIILLLCGIDEILLQAGGVGMTAGVEARLRPFQRRTPRPLTEGDQVVTTRDEIDRILREQGCNPLSDAQWTQLFE